MRSWHDFQLVQLFMLPMFLFATTFYPLGVYPGLCRSSSNACRCTTPSSSSGCPPQGSSTAASPSRRAIC
ncbi:hypothetical protein ACFQ60_02165 [Streptomyces zhihengii]